MSLVSAILMGMRWHCTVVLICIPLMTKDGEHLFMYLFAIIHAVFRSLALFFFQGGCIGSPLLRVGFL